MGGRSDCDFCALCGTMLVYESATTASCALCKAQRNAEGMIHRSIAHFLLINSLFGVLVYIYSTQWSRRRCGVNEDCPKCKNPQLEYYTRQLRSADEGQTVFYECPKCRHKFSQNT
ncbi:hypothetical protein SELMODRAFT_83849 [Selaginella moellendorffii]|uniref:DNA-directed RNA polymerase subunit n=1 Tax=Selaginella moellendorffii TaxID=88036 RepID=D8R331_SELML|nr:hypothetical protein SELMODRAFT_83849 [Selaginella moellendorffii]